MAKARIYDAEFDQSTPKSHHAHLAKFWWVDQTGKTGTWTRPAAHGYVLAHPGDIYVAEEGRSVEVRPYHSTKTGTVWIQTVADGTERDNLLTLAKRHDRGLPNR